jgi:hypothetical protein
MPTCSAGHAYPYGSRFCMTCAIPVPYEGDPSVRREFYWVPPDRRVQMPSEQVPDNVWTVVSHQGSETPPEPIHAPTPHRNIAFHEDRGHDWQMEGSVIRYFSRGADHSVWIMVEFPA